ncbi:NAD-dependent epimerase/dehydratase family protein [Mycobacterium sp. IDR2000157661]|uniref:NAD-dependent epimerase/dehydratase family protein n=1 Tax=Mycobacterium sp. IDR2000157661 TaxID=2867005 RepID=UPI001EEC763C|nr:NAD(P)-dependent oxidoreductase [Mycobacterium sp. IDR2000157661]ULE33107.1 NAD(P)-dependent oxidoreductase [Mycobacterium sp. IDR2000157661]
MVAVVTGGAGFIGRVLVSDLAERGPVISIDREPVAPSDGVTAITADLLDESPQVRAALTEAQVVYHLAGCPDVRDPRPDADERRHRDNVVATAAVLSAVPPDVPLVVTSSSSVYGGTVAGRGCLESDVLDPRGGYARSKRAAERLCEERLQAGGLVCTARPFTVAGEGQRPGMAVSRWIAAVRAGRPLPLYGSPRRSRDITDVRDAARALAGLGAAGARGLVNIGTGVGHTIEVIATAVCRTLGVAPHFVIESGHPAEVEHTLADTTRLRELLGWVPHTDLDELVARQVEATLVGA